MRRRRLESNGEADEDRRSEIFGDAKAAATNGESVHVSGSIARAGTPLKVDLRIDGTKGGKGTITVRGAPVEIVRIGDEAYIKGSTAFYAQIAGRRGRPAPERQVAEGLGDSRRPRLARELTDINQLFNGALNPDGKLTKGKRDDRRRAEGDRDQGHRGRHALRRNDRQALSGRIKQASGGSTGAVHFDEWNETVTSRRPKARSTSPSSNG